MEGLLEADARGVFPQRVTQEHKQCQDGDLVTKCDQGREEDILPPSCRAQYDLRVVRTSWKGW